MRLMKGRIEWTGEGGSQRGHTDDKHEHRTIHVYKPLDVMVYPMAWYHVIQLPSLLAMLPIE
jgi:hypothetical protein